MNRRLHQQRIGNRACRALCFVVGLRARHVNRHELCRALAAADDAERELETHRAQAFDQEFIDLARSVYIENDERAAIKREINLKLGSTLVEEKSYQDYRAPQA